MFRVQGADSPQQLRGILQPFAAVQAQLQASQAARQRRGAAEAAQGAAAAEAQGEVLGLRWPGEPENSENSPKNVGKTMENTWGTET